MDGTGRYENRRAPSHPDGLSYGAVITLINSNNDVFHSQSATLGFGGPFRLPKTESFVSRSNKSPWKRLFISPSGNAPDPGHLRSSGGDQEHRPTEIIKNPFQGLLHNLDAKLYSFGGLKGAQQPNAALWQRKTTLFELIRVMTAPEDSPSGPVWARLGAKGPDGFHSDPMAPHWYHKCIKIQCYQILFHIFDSYLSIQFCSKVTSFYFKHHGGYRNDNFHGDFGFNNYDLLDKKRVHAVN